MIKKGLLILLCLPFLFAAACKKEESEIEPDSTIYNVWQLSVQSISLSHGSDYSTQMVWLDSTTNIVYSGYINSIGSGPILVSKDTIFPSSSSNDSSRVWSINQNQIIDNYYDGFGFLYNTSQHSFIKNSDTLVVNFQSGEMKKYIINELTADNLHIASIPKAYNDPFSFLFPLFDENGIYQDTVLMNINSDEYSFSKI